MANVGARSRVFFTKLLRDTLFLRADSNIKIPITHHRSVLFVREIKKLPRQKDKRDGHCVNPRDYYWEQRMKYAPKSPLAIEPINIIQESLKKEKPTFSKREKGMAVVAVISMLAAVVSFKMTFGNSNYSRKSNEITEPTKEEVQEAKAN